MLSTEMSQLELFDREVLRATDVRGPEYGHPLDNFSRVALVKKAVASCPHDAIRHALEMIGVKMCRLATSPHHMDSVVDIAGYARTIVMIIDEERLRHGKNT